MGSCLWFYIRMTEHDQNGQNGNFKAFNSAVCRPHAPIAIGLLKLGFCVGMGVGAAGENFARPMRFLVDFILFSCLIVALRRANLGVATPTPLQLRLVAWLLAPSCSQAVCRQSLTLVRYAPCSTACSLVCGRAVSQHL